MSDPLPPAQATLLLATRCFGRATPFPHHLLQIVLIKRELAVDYDEVIADLVGRGLLEHAGPGAVELTRAGRDWRSFETTPTPVWAAAVEAMTTAVALSLEAENREALDLLSIHAAALGNVFRERVPGNFVHLRGLAMMCSRALGREHQADQDWQEIQAVLREQPPDDSQ